MAEKKGTILSALRLTTTEDARQARLKEREETKNRVRVETIKTFVEKTIFLQDATIGHAWQAYQDEIKRQNIEPGKYPEYTAPLQFWRVISETIRTLEKMGVELIGFSSETGLETVAFDPTHHNFAGMVQLDPDTKRFGAREESPPAGTKVRVSTPGYKIDDEIFQYPTVVKV